jgi:hypothetical protein
MYVILPIALVAAVVVLAVIRRSRRDRCDRIHQAPPEPCVLLSVRPDRTAIVTLDVKSDATSSAVAWLVDAAVREAFGLASVDDVEVRRSDGVLLDRPHRPAPPLAFHGQVPSSARQTLAGWGGPPPPPASGGMLLGMSVTQPPERKR